MFDRISDRWKKDAGGALWLVVIAAASLATAAVAVSFLCAAVFVVALDRYGLVAACLAGAGVFLLATLALLGAYAIHAARRRRDAEARAASEPPPLSALADPQVILVGLQIAQAIGFKRLLPILAIARGRLRPRFQAGVGGATRRRQSAWRRSSKPPSSEWALKAERRIRSSTEGRPAELA